MKRNLFTLLTLVLLCAPVTIVAQKKSNDPNSLYNRLGKKAAITAVVDEFVANMAGDERVNSFFQTTAGDPKRMAAFKKNLVYQICEAAGGPEKYKGKTMEDAHKGMNIQNNHWDATVECLVKALNKLKVPAKEQGDLLGAIGQMKPQIVGK